MAEYLIKHSVDAEFDTLVIDKSKSKLVLVDFWAEWCGPCKAVAPILDQLAEKYQENLDIVKVDIEASNNREYATKYQVQGIPTVIIFKDGNEVGRQVGALSLAGYEEFIKPQL